ncbi:hypothetical protein BN8_01461 [Fibrisoma limi BUZ 3]|uniref:Uncharacterized protein n=1 Tax=Fibrisoma limi BUZ 3 TaxID=1185876 RepID=I2GEY3_9BACT|nr:hypothetical protein [Fibrisoma limi]CCH52458.1 hypothetical protein BN8_01461 [Fibrisoma limi BUZ 3]
MKNVKHLISKYSEGYLIVITFLCGYLPPLTIAPIFLGLIAILAFQLISKNRITGIIIASLFLLINVLMLLAVVSEFNEFLTATPNAIQLLLIGFLIFGFNLIVSALMMSKYLPEGERVSV